MSMPGMDPYFMMQGGPRRDYFMAQPDNIGTLKYRADPNEIIRNCMDALEGIERDRYLRIVSKSEPLLNHEGLNRIKSFLIGHITKVTHLTWYENEERINRQIKHYLRGTLYIITRNRKSWDIKLENRTLIVNILEKNLHESMLKSHRGFEAEITGKSWSVNENINPGDNVSNQIQPAPGGGGLFGWLRR